MALHLHAVAEARTPGTDLPVATDQIFQLTYCDHRRQVTTRRIQVLGFEFSDDQPLNPKPQLWMRAVEVDRDPPVERKFSTHPSRLISLAPADESAAELAA